ncbi:hypothetical protein IWW45_002523 [Coemansia sp. RSA 485]|nr:hypothetical protein IWW45_002523 [Coemansia sp. RSA 485]
MNDEFGPGSVKNIRNFDFGSTDDDLEAIQKEFLTSNSKPAATVIRSNKAPVVIGSSQKQQHAQSKDTAGKSTDTAAPDAEQVSSSSILDFARRMSEAVKEFEVKERIPTNTDTSDDSDKRPLSGDASAPKVTGQQPAQKKLSLFAQRRLAKQAQGSESSTGRSKVNGPRSAATFLPKLMAPVPEHALTEPVTAPRMQPRESGFPAVPVDFNKNTLEAREAMDDQGVSEIHMHPSQAANKNSNTDTWSEVRQQVSVENTTRINSMSQADILEAQDEIRTMFSSETIQRLMRRKQAQAQETPSKSAANLAETADKKMAVDNTNAKSPKQVRFADSQDLDHDPETPDYEDEFSAPPPPPPAEWVDQDGVVDKSESSNDGDRTTTAVIDVDNNDTGVDSDFYTEMKRKYFPSEVVEEAKLAWILGHGQSKSPMEKAVRKSRQDSAEAAAAKVRAGSGAGGGASNSGNLDEQDLLSKPVSHIRFAFDGQIMTEEQMDIPTMAGLHHHGENPDKPGYTIPELLHLSRSTVPAQRSVATSTLACILHKINVGGWDIPQSVEIYVGLLDWQTELYFAHGIADSNKTCRAESTIALWTWIVEMFKYKSLVRMANGGQMEVESSTLPGAEIEMLPKPIVAQGELVSRTFKAFDAILTASFMESVYEIINRSTMAEQQLTLLAECIKCLGGMSEEFGQRIQEHSRLTVLLQNRYPFLMSK